MMGYNGENARKVVFDLETAPLLDAANYLVEPISAPSNYKSPEAIARYVEDAKAAQLEKCSLDPDLCRIVALGWQIEGMPVHVGICEHEEAEAEVLNLFWYQASALHLVGFNCLAFDLPVLLRRALYLDAARPSIQIDKYKHPQVTDLQMVLSFNGAQKMHSLSFYAKRFGIPSDDTLTGADIGQAVKEGRWEDVRSHCRADVLKTAAVAAKMGLFTCA